MSYSFCFGPSGSGKSHYLRKMIIERAGKSLSSLGKDRTKYIVIVPEQYSMQTQHELIDEDPRHVLMNVDVLSFGRLAHRVFSETGEDRRAVLDDIGKSLLLRRAASGCFSDLQILRRGIHSPGMIDEIKSVLSEFMQYGIGLEQIEEMAVFAEANKRNALSARLRDIKKLYAAFREAKEDRYVTSEETMDLLAAAIPKAVSLRGSVIVFDGFTGFTTVQYRVVTELIRCAKEVIFSFTVSTDSGPDIAVTADGGSEGAEENLFYLTRKTVKDIIRIASKERLPRGKDIYFTDGLPRFKDSPVLAHLEQNLFRYPETAFEEKKEGETDRSLQIIAAPTPREEVRRIFSRIGEIIANTGCAYRDFAIVTADLETYGDFFALEASRSGIPVYIDRTSGVFHNILIEGIRSVLQISSENFSYASVFRYLRSGLSRLSTEQVDLLENYCLANGVRGRKKWAVPFDADCEEARLRFLREVEPVTGPLAVSAPVLKTGSLPEPETTDTGEINDTGETTDTSEINDTGETTAAGKTITAGETINTGEITDTSEITDTVISRHKTDIGAGVQIDSAKAVRTIARRPRTCAERTKELYEFLIRVDAQARVFSLSESFGKTGDVVREKQYSQIYQKVIDLLDQIHDLTGGERISARDYLELLEAGLSQIRLGTLPQRVDRVLVGDIERTRLTQIRHLFIAGVNEGNIPRSASRGGILSDMDREFLAAGGTVLAPTPRQQMFIQRLYLYMNMTKPSETLSVSFAKVSQDGKSLRPSYLVSMLRNLFPAVSVEITDKLPQRNKIMDRSGGQSALADLLRRFVDGSGDRSHFEEDFTLLYGFYTSPEVMADPAVSRAVNRLRAAALFRYRPGRLAPGVARAVYGSKVFGGISRMETGALCMLRQHMRYGLSLRERETYEFREADAGTVLHAALQRFDSLLRAEKISWKDFTEEDASRLSERALLEESANYRNLLMYKSFRDQNRLRTFQRRLLRTVETLQYQIRQGDFLPVAAELGFGGGKGELPPIRFDLGRGRELVLNGRIDRVDICEENGRRFIRIMDYKSGSRDLDPEQIRRGLQLQLITYMEALKREKDSVPSAMLYYRMFDPVINISPEEALTLRYSGNKGAGRDSGRNLTENTEEKPAGSDSDMNLQDGNGEGASVGKVSASLEAEEKILKEIRKKLCPTGLVYNDRESVSHLDKYFSNNSDVIPVARKKDGDFTAASRVIDPQEYDELADAAAGALCRVANGILDGDVAAAPAVIDSRRTACDYCPYREACGFDIRIPGYERRKS